MAGRFRRSAGRSGSTSTLPRLPGRLRRRRSFLGRPAPRRRRRRPVPRRLGFAILRFPRRPRFHFAVGRRHHFNSAPHFDLPAGFKPISVDYPISSRSFFLLFFFLFCLVRFGLVLMLLSLMLMLTSPLPGTRD